MTGGISLYCNSGTDVTLFDDKVKFLSRNVDDNFAYPSISCLPLSATDTKIPIGTRIVVSRL